MLLIMNFLCQALVVNLVHDIKGMHLTDDILFSLQIQKQINKALDDVTSSLPFLKDEKGYIKALPAQGISQDELLEKMKDYSSMSMFVSLQY